MRRRASAPGSLDKTSSMHGFRARSDAPRQVRQSGSLVTYLTIPDLASFSRIRVLLLAETAAFGACPFNNFSRLRGCQLCLPMKQQISARRHLAFLDYPRDSCEQQPLLYRLQLF